LNWQQEVDAAALVCLEKAYVQHSNTITSLKVEQRFDPLRSDPHLTSFAAPHRLKSIADASTR
jgi:hypothetical protein